MNKINVEHFNFFTVELPDKYKIYRKYGNFPDHAADNRLKIDDYEEIAREFYEWARRNLGPCHLLSQELVRKELYLLKSEYFDDKSEDIAYFGDIITNVKKNRVNVRITQTGGINSSIYFFSNFPDIKNKLDRKKADRLMLESIYALLNNPAKIEALIADISETGDIFEIQRKPVAQWEYQLQTFQGFLFRNTLCFTFRKDTFSKDGRDVPAREPMPDEWFDYHRRR